MALADAEDAAEAAAVELEEQLDECERLLLEQLKGDKVKLTDEGVAAEAELQRAFAARRARPGGRAGRVRVAAMQVGARLEQLLADTNSRAKRVEADLAGATATATTAAARLRTILVERESQLTSAKRALADAKAAAEATKSLANERRAEYAEKALNAGATVNELKAALAQREREVAEAEARATKAVKALASLRTKSTGTDTLLERVRHV